MLSYATMIVMTKRSVFLTAFSVFFDEKKKRGDADHVGLHIWDLLYALLDSCVLVMLLRSRPSVDFPFFYMPIHQLSAHTSLHTLFHTLFCFLFDFFNNYDGNDHNACFSSADFILSILFIHFDLFQFIVLDCVEIHPCNRFICQLALLFSFSSCSYYVHGHRFVSPGTFIVHPLPATTALRRLTFVLRMTSNDVIHVDIVPEPFILSIWDLRRIFGAQINNDGKHMCRNLGHYILHPSGRTTVLARSDPLTNVFVNLLRSWSVRQKIRLPLPLRAGILRTPPFTSTAVPRV